MNKADPKVLLAHHLKKLKLPTILAEYDKQARLCAEQGIDHPRYLLRLAELTGRGELARRAESTLTAFGQRVNAYPVGYASVLLAVDFLAAGASETTAVALPAQAAPSASGAASASAESVAATLLAVRGGHHLYIGRDDDAEIHYRAAIRVDDAFAAPHHNLGNLALRRGDSTAAIAACDAAARIQDRNPYLHYHRGLAYLNQGDLELLELVFRHYQRLEQFAGPPVLAFRVHQGGLGGRQVRERFRVLQTHQNGSSFYKPPLLETDIDDGGRDLGANFHGFVGPRVTQRFSRQREWLDRGLADNYTRGLGLPLRFGNGNDQPEQQRSSRQGNQFQMSQSRCGPGEP